MKKLFTILFSMVVVFALAQEKQRPNDGPKPISHSPLLCPSFVMTPVDGTIITVDSLVKAIVGTGIAYSNVNFAGLQGNIDASAGLFTGGVNAGIGIESGIVLSCGYINNAIGPNSFDGVTAVLDLPGDANLNTLSGVTTHDATILEFDFVPDFNQLYIQFVFGSDEYNEYVNSPYNDVFAFFLNGTDVAVVPSTTTPIAVNTINNGLNSIYYKDNDYSDFYPGPYPYCTEMDGFTVVMVATGAVTAGQTNHIKLAIADGSDYVLDSWVFIKTEGFGGDDPRVPVSNWAIFIGLFLIVTFAVIRFRRML